MSSKASLRERLLKLSKKKLMQKCSKYKLETTGSKRKLVERIICYKKTDDKPVKHTTEKKSAVCMLVVNGITRQYLTENQGVSTISQLIYIFAFSLHKGIWKTSKMFNRNAGVDYKIKLQINNDLTFQLKISVHSFCGQTHNFVESLNGYIRIIDDNKYLMLFEYYDGLQLKKQINGNKDSFVFRNSEKFNPTVRQRVYTQRVIALYQRMNYRMNEEKLKHIHREYIEKCIKKQKLSCEYYENYSFEWTVISMKLKDDLKQGLLNVDKCSYGGKVAEDMHILYECLCKSFGVDAQGMYVGELYVVLDNEGKTANIQLNHKSIFAEKCTLKKKSQEN